MQEETNVKEKLIAAGKKEFMTYGYEKASLRRICNEAEVTTGALYFFFKNKEDFFCSIVKDVAEYYKNLLHKFTESELSGEHTSEENDRELMSFFYDKKEEITILMERAQGSPYEDFMKEICDILLESFLLCFRQYGGQDVDTELIRIIVKMRICGYLEIIHGDLDLKQAIKYAELLAEYGDSGFAGMLKQYHKMAEGMV